MRCYMQLSPRATICMGPQIRDCTERKVFSDNKGADSSQKGGERHRRRKGTGPSAK